MGDLTGRVALVTGSANNIGRETCLQLARLGATVVSHARSDREGAEETARLAAAEGATAGFELADVSTPDGAQGLVEAVVAAHGGLHILVSNAAIRSNLPLAEIDYETWQRVMRTNVDAAFLLCQAAVPHMAAAGWGRIVLVGGLAAHRGVKKRVHIATSKAALIGMAKALASEFAEDGITANVVVPGMIDTVRGAAAGGAPHGGHPNLMGREGKPEEVAHAILGFCHPAGAYTTGQTLHVNGGAYLP